MTGLNSDAGAYAGNRSFRPAREYSALAREVEAALAHIAGGGDKMSPVVDATARAAVVEADRCMSGLRQRLASAEYALADAQAGREEVGEALDRVRDLADEREAQFNTQHAALQNWRGIVLGLAEDLRDEDVLSNPLLTPAAFNALAHVAALFPRRDEPGARRPPAVLFRHYKGGLYRLICRARTEDGADPVVVYQDVGTGRSYVRPVAEWTEAVAVRDGALGETFVRRFAPIEAAPVDVSVTGDA